MKIYLNLQKFIIGGTADLDNKTFFMQLINEAGFTDNLSGIDGPSFYHLKYRSDELQRDACLIAMLKQNAFVITGGSLNAK